MKKGVVIAIISVVAVAVIAGGLFVVIPLATSKEAETRLDEAFTEAGIPADMWSADKVYYVPLLGNLVLEKPIFGEKSGGAFIKAKKITLALDKSREDLFAGSADAQDLSFQADNAGIIAKSLSVKDFSVDKELFKHSPPGAVKKLGSIRLSDAVFTQKGKAYLSLATLNADVGYVEGKIPPSSSVAIKDFVMDVRQFMPLPALRPEYRLSSLELKNSLSGSVYTANLVAEGANLFTINANLGISLPRELLASGEVPNLTLSDYEKDVKLNSLTLSYTDKSLLDHIFELAGMTGGRESAAKQLDDVFMMFAMSGGIDADRFTSEAKNFIAKPGTFELKTNIASPVSFKDISRNPLVMNLSLSINGGKPFTTGKH